MAETNSGSPLSETLNALVGETVEIKCIDDGSYSGVLYCLDPDTMSVILLKQGDDDSRILPENSVCHNDTTINLRFILIMGHSIQSFSKIISNANDQNYVIIDRARKYTESYNRTMKEPTERTRDGDDLRMKKADIVQYLNKMGLDITEETNNDAIIIGNIAKISSPYTVDDCRCMNENVLRRLQDLLNSFEYIQTSKSFSTASPE